MAISIPGAMDFLVMGSNPPIFCDVSTGIHQKDTVPELDNILSIVYFQKSKILG